MEHNDHWLTDVIGERLYSICCRAFAGEIFRMGVEDIWQEGYDVSCVITVNIDDPDDAEFELLVADCDDNIRTGTVCVNIDDGDMIYHFHSGCYLLMRESDQD